MAFPSKAKIKKVLKKLENVEGTLAPPANPTPLQKFRHDIQQKFVKYILDKKISQREMAEILGVDEGKVSKILHNRLEEFSTDRLINLYEKLDPNVKLRVG
jgi:predicted XRE-type DNA-binding protein